MSSFQSSVGLEATGVCDLATWTALGFSEDSWYTMDAYVHPCRVDASYTRSQIIDAFLETAYDYLGTTYVVGAAGAPGTGCDCSGLVLQCLYSIGIYPEDYNVVQHTEKEYNSRLMAADPHFAEISYDELQPGDLVFYKKYVNVCHVAIYIGNGKCIENYAGSANIYSIDKSGWGYSYAGFRRVIADV